jgi:hypothetical protein
VFGSFVHSINVPWLAFKTMPALTLRGCLGALGIFMAFAPSRSVTHARGKQYTNLDGGTAFNIGRKRGHGLPGALGAGEVIEHAYDELKRSGGPLQGLLALRGGGEDNRSRRRLVKGKRSIELPPGFFGKPPPKEGTLDKSSTDATGGGREEKGNPFAPLKVGKNPFAPSIAGSGEGGASQGGSIFSIAGASGGSMDNPFGRSSGGNPFGAPASVLASGNPFASSASSSAPAGFVASPFGVQPSPNFGFGAAEGAGGNSIRGNAAVSELKSSAAGSGEATFGFSGASIFGAPGKEYQKSAIGS